MNPEVPEVEAQVIGALRARDVGAEAPQGGESYLARDGREGVEAFTQHAARLRAVVLDVAMPGMNGGEALQEIPRLRALAGAPYPP